MRRRVLLVVAITAGWVVSFSSYMHLARALYPRQHRITEATIGQIRRGMSREEIADLLAAPPGYRAPRKTEEVCRKLMGPLTNDSETWVGDEAAVIVFFDPAGRAVCHFGLRVEDRGASSYPELFGRWLGLL
jgi:hypothetical protein